MVLTGHGKTRTRPDARLDGLAFASGRILRSKRRTHRSFTIGARFLSALVTIVGIASPTRAGLVDELNATLTKLPHAQTKVGACVIDLATGQTIFSKEADRPLTPASCMKVFAMATALTELGPDFQFETILASDGRNLIVIGDGDPGFGDEKLCRSRKQSVTAALERWSDALVAKGLDRIPGDLIIDESIFEPDRIHPSWDERDLDNWYAAPVGGLNINDNCLDVTVIPARERGATPKIEVQPPTSLARFVNAAKSGLKGEPVLRHRYDTYEYTIGGQVPKRWRFGAVPFPDPGLLFADALRGVMSRSNIALAGQIRTTRVRHADGSLPPGLTIIAKHHTPLADVLQRAGKDSQNLFAECLLKRAGYAWARRNGGSDAVGSWSTGRQAVMELVHRAEIDPQGLQVADGSGLSRDNASTARQLAMLIAWSARQPWSKLFHDSLAEAGVDGSLKKRLRDTPGAVFAKTGTMQGVRALAGYVDGAGGPRYAFAILFNGYPGGSAPYKAIQDKFCRILLENSGSRSARK